MKKCLNCDNETTNPKFCSKSCSATYTNKNKVKSQETKDKISKKVKEYLKENPHSRPLSDKALEKRKEYLDKQRSKPFDELSSRYKRIRVLEEQDHKCLSCGLSNWLGKPIPFELDHIDGNNYNNIRSNLRILCPNCHSQTPTWRRGKKSLLKTDDDMYNAYLKCGTISKAMKLLKMGTNAATYERFYKIISERE